MPRDIGDQDCSVYMFEALEELLAAAKALSVSGFRGGSAAYSGFGAFFLIIYEKTHDTAFYGIGAASRFGDAGEDDALSGYRNRKKETATPSFASEFGTQLPSGYEKYVEEHCECLIRCSAVNVLSPLV